MDNTRLGPEERSHILMHLGANDDASTKYGADAGPYVVSQIGLLCEVLMSIDLRLADVVTELQIMTKRHPDA